MCRAAAGVDPGAAQIWRWGNDQQITDLIDLAKWLRQRGWLRADTTPTEAGRSLAVLSGHETYWRLVSEQHWSTTRYRRWLHRHCALELTSSGADLTEVALCPAKTPDRPQCLAPERRGQAT